MVKPDKEGNKKSHPTHVQGFHLARKIEYIEFFSRHKIFSIIFKQLPPVNKHMTSGFIFWNARVKRATEPDQLQHELDRFLMPLNHPPSIHLFSNQSVAYKEERQLPRSHRLNL